MVPLWLEGVFIAQVNISNFPKRKVVESNDPTGLGLSHVMNPASSGNIVRFIANLGCDKARKKKYFTKQQAANSKPARR